MYNDFPEEMHENLGITGKFNKKINEKVYLNDGTIMEMDSSYIAGPDFKEIFRINMPECGTSINTSYKK